MAVKEKTVMALMTSYNPINGHWAASNYDLCTTVLRGEWGYEGIVMTDWRAKMNDVVEGGEESNQDTRDMVRSQNDVYMIVNNNGAEVNLNSDNTESSVEAGTLTVGELQRAAMNICNFILNAPVIERELVDTDGNWITQKLCKVKLDKGAYNIKLEDVLAGIKVKYMQFKKLKKK